MITFKNAAVSSEWIIDLKEYSQVENSLPMTGLNIRNDSNIVVYVDLDGLKVGEVQRYSADAYIGRNFSGVRVYNPDGEEFAVDDLFLQITKGEVVGSQPFNPQWDVMIFELDRFASGTDRRISASSTTPAELVKYWINVQNSTIVQRRIDLQAHSANLGTYEITFGKDDIVFGAVGIGVPPPPDTQQYKKTIINHAFDYSLTNATLIGWIIDYKFNPNDISDRYVVVAGGDSADNAYNDDLNDATDEYASGGAEATLWEVSFPAQDIDRVHVYFQRKSAGTGRTWIKYYSAGAWHNLYYLEWSGAGYTTVYVNETGLALSAVTKLRMTSYYSTHKIYDVSVF